MAQIAYPVMQWQLVNEPDHVELSRLVIEHAWRSDNGLSDTLHELYVDDGELILPRETIRGAEQLREWGRKIVANTPWRCIRHVCGNMRFVSLGDGEAEGTTVLTVYMTKGKGASMTIPYHVGEDHDRFRRTEDGWRIVSRRWVELFSRGETP